MGYGSKPGDGVQTAVAAGGQNIPLNRSEQSEGGLMRVRLGPVLPAALLAGFLLSIVSTSFAAPVVQFQNVTAARGVNANEPRSQAVGDDGADGDLELFFS